MAIHKLRPRQVETVKKDGMYADGGGLYLQVRHDGASKSWIFRFTVDGHERAMELGPLDTVGLAEARERAQKCRLQRLDGIDPIDARNALRLEQTLAKAKVVTFRRCAESWMAVHDVSWSPDTAARIKRRLEMYAYPHLDNGNMPIQKLDGDASNAPQLIADLLTPIWKTMSVAAEQVRGYIQSVLEYAAAKRYIGNPNAASLKGPLGQLLPAQKTFYQVTHHEALPFEQVGQFMAALRSCVPQVNTLLSLNNRPLMSEAIEFLVLTAVRKGQVSNAEWAEFDLDKGIWVSSEHKSKKKTGQDYIVPLSKQAMAVLHRMRELQATNKVESKYVFAGDSNRPIHGGGFNKFLWANMGREDFTVHGFRTTFKVWSLEHGHPEVESEMALGHTVGNTVRQIYARLAKVIEPRRLMMQEWADYCDQTEPLSAGIAHLGHERAKRRKANGDE